MINPNGDDFVEKDVLGASKGMSEDFVEEDVLAPQKHMIGEGGSSSTAAGFRQTTRNVSSAAGDAWEQTKEKAGVARERAEFFLRENPVPTLLGALGVGLALGLAIRYASRPKEEIEVKSRLGDFNWSALSLPFLWPFLKSVRERYDDSTAAVKEGVGRLKKVDVDRYVKPIRKRWNAWSD